MFSRKTGKTWPRQHNQAKTGSWFQVAIYYLFHTHLWCQHNDSSSCSMRMPLKGLVRWLSCNTIKMSLSLCQNASSHSCSDFCFEFWWDNSACSSCTALQPHRSHGSDKDLSHYTHVECFNGVLVWWQLLTQFFRTERNSPPHVGHVVLTLILPRENNVCRLKTKCTCP